MKKTLILLFALVASIGTIQAETYSGTCGENLNWKLDTEQSVLDITGYGAMTNFSKAPWYAYKKNIKHINLPQGITSIGQFAFTDCSNLIEIKLPESILSLGEKAFFNCTDLIEITIPENVRRVGKGVIFGCSSLKTVYWNAICCDTLDFGHSDKETSRTVVFGDKVKKVPSEFTRFFIGGGGGNAPSGKNTSLKKIVFNDSIEIIGSYAFSRCDSLVQEIILPKHLKTLGSYCFAYCPKITGCILPDELININEGVFYGCYSLKWSCLNIPNSVQVLRQAFNINHYDSVRIGEGVRKITDLTFGSYQYQRYNDSLKYVEYNAIDAEWQLGVDGCVNSGPHGYFSQCRKIEKVVIGNKVKKIPDYFLSSGNPGSSSCAQFSPIKAIVIPNSVTKVGKYAFFGIKTLETIVLSENIDTVLRCAFSQLGGTKDMTLHIPNKIRYIGDYAFDKYYYTTLGTKGYFHINAIPDSARYIGYRAFNSCNYPSDTLFLPQHIDTIINCSLWGG